MIRTLVQRYRARPKELVLYLVLGTVAAAATFVGAGLTGSRALGADLLAWLGNDDGQVIGVDAEAGRPQDRLQLGGPDDEMRVTQDNGVLVVRNLNTDEVTIVDLPTLAAREMRPGDPNSTKVLLTQGRIYVADKAAGLVQRIDPVTAETIGQPWLTDVLLVDAVADRAGTIWVLGQGGQLVSLLWSEQSTAFTETTRVTVSGAGPRAVLVPHLVGVTALDPDSGSVVQVGTGRDIVTEVTDLAAPLVVADFSPAELVPFSAPLSSAVLVVRDGTVVAQDTSLLGCATPGKPVVYHGMVYASCPGNNKVIVLDSAGRSIREIATPAGGDPILVLVNDKLIVNVPGADTGLVILADGSARTIRTNDPQVPVRSASPRPSNDRGDHRTKSPTPTRTRPARTTAPPGGPPRGAPTTTPPPAVAPPATQPPPPPPPPPPPNSTPTSVAAIALLNGNVRVTWSPGPGAISSYRILHADTLAVLGTAAGTATTALVNGQAYLDEPIALIVEAVTDSGGYRSAPSNTVIPYVQPRDPPPCRGCQIP